MSQSAADPSTTATVTAQPSGMLAPSHWVDTAPQAEEDGNRGATVDDDDSAFMDEGASSSASISSSILQYRVINGRTYHSDRGDATYWASNDDQQNESLDILHHLSYLSMNGKLHLAPLKKESVKSVLDVGTGTGIWAIDFADENPGSEVMGTDISPIQPSWVPPNLRFEIEDFTKAWSFADNSFNYVHMRYLFGSVTDWYELFRQSYRVCRPGGWVESYEGSAMCYSDDGTLKHDSAMAEWGKFFIEGAKRLGRVFTPIPDSLQEKGLEAAGFVDITSSTMKIPVGGWPKDERLKEIGRFAQLTLESDVEGYVSFMAGLLEGWTQQQILMYCAQFRRELKAKKAHGYYLQRVVYARKPETSTA
ncbi:Secondary metabolism regulator LAE1 like protein [Verticillium longisporum]|uniref:Methyltransferase n=3 Tax=Verticillium TaxID=1036719 RepID=G2WQV8_VERDV|nr:uncharacterized protein VDAG_00750 [Verticillium dahliae VdLs.17]KAF3350852.1 Caffeine resistance protein 5 [Verticillium dahliae VDG2]KAF3359937.1 hypothetical protein VdG1_01627 [Verticillium dahliae VDG1]KAG7119673.1 Secondary metabolism regulator LAE1 like protein [Verticillium longisporum]KAH6706668.1 S-adenosyl-L-methionine-dependent methyltransferase [Verticillium dahliae]EGY14068.1 hypothetical protein VDAG_00750 [Verticillium dahliae VdLs.17]